MQIITSPNNENDPQLTKTVGQQKSLNINEFIQHEYQKASKVVNS